MSKMHFFRLSGFLTSALTLALLTLAIFSPVGRSHFSGGEPQKLIAQKLQGLPLLLANTEAEPGGRSRGGGSRLKFVLPVLDNTEGEPGGRSRGGGSRGPCQQYEALTALVPVMKTAANKDLVLGLTAGDRPTFWFYVPKGLSAEVPVEFILQDQNDNTVYWTKFKATETPAGVMSIAVPPVAPALEAGKTYQWTLSVYCDPEKPSSATYVKGSVKRVGLDGMVTRQLATAKTPLERATLYANQGVWYDALTILGEERRRSGGETPAIAEAWSDLLQQANLESVAKALVTPCCTLQSSQPVTH